MAQTGFTPISNYYSATATNVPTAGNLVAGELAINTADGKLFYKDSSGVVQTMASKDANSGTFTNTSVSGVASFADGTVSLPSITNIGDTNTGIYFPAADTIAFTEGGAEAMRIDSSGNVGIGITSPNAPLQVQANSSGIAVRVSGRSSDGYSDISLYNNANTVNNAFFGSSNTATFLGTGTTIPLTFQVNNTERMRINSDGQLIVNSTSQIGGRINSYGDASFAAYYGQVSVNGDFVFGIRNQSGTVVGGIVANSGSVSYNTTSDYRLKENIAPMTGALNKISALKPVTYTWKATGEATQGFIAHELAEIIPDCVTGEKDAVDVEGNPKYQGIDTSFLVATLTAAIQELNAKVDAQALEIATLKAK
jgi:hypothetical protein